jgi:hypothetical protein
MTASSPAEPDVKRSDKERNIGESADLSGYKVTVTTAAFQHQLSHFGKDGYLVADVTLANRDRRFSPTTSSSGSSSHRPVRIIPR